MINVIMLGITGSIGENFLNVYDSYKKYINIVAVSYNSNYEKFNLLNKKYKFSKVFVTNKKNFNFSDMDIFLKDKKIHLLINGIKGSEGLKYTIWTIKNKINIGLANKESLILGGKWIINLAKQNKVNIFPIDSEHSSIYWCLKNSNIKRNDINKLILTASGGSFVDVSKEQLMFINDNKAFSHPTWKMGTEITINSSTMVNKIFEIIEAKYLFEMPINKFDILIHRQSIVHSILITKMNDSILNASFPTMELPIYYSIFGKLYDFKPVVKNVFGNSYLNLTFEKLGNNFNHVNKIIELSQNKKYGEILLLIVNEYCINLFIKKKIKFYEISILIIRLMTNYSTKLKLLPNSSLNIEKIIKNIKKYIIGFHE